MRRTFGNLLITLNSNFYIIFLNVSGAGELSVPSDENFILLERLCMTLERQMKIWKRQQRRAKKIISPIFNICGSKGCRGTGSQISSWDERINVAKDFASAMTYLHKNRYE